MCKYLCLALVAIMFVPSDAFARGRRYTQQPVYQSNSTAVGIVSGSGAQAKAEAMARMQSMQHLGGGFGGGSFEGVGMASTRDGAITRCCFWGQRTPIEIGAAQGANGMWYAAVFYR